MKTLNELIFKYNRPGPRYTSYPPVPFWKNAPCELDWLAHVKKSYQEDVGIDLYIHVPFCESLCYYCGCNRTITKNHSVEKNYLTLILKEWDIYQKKLGHSLKINSLHFGGGTPTFLSPKNLEILIESLLKNKSETFVGSIEIDPRTCKDEHLEILSKLNIKRVSLGIQDFDIKVQKSINRDQSPAMIYNLVEKLRTHQFSSINFDLIYGLPNQTLETISETMKIVADMKPDLIAFYSYAHLPERIKNQRLIVESELPSAELKRELYELGKMLLINNGYIDIGMDHFALSTSILFKAKMEGSLHRNFMGYVDKKSNVLIGLGPTSISDSSLSFVQNSKELKNYEQKVLAGDLPIEMGHSHNENDLLIQEILLHLMCYNEFTIKKFEDLPYWEEIKKELIIFEQDGLIEMDNNRIQITSIGKGFVRNVAMTFDYHLRQQSSIIKFSQTI